MRLTLTIGLLAAFLAGGDPLPAADTAKPVHWSMVKVGQPSVPRFDKPAERAWVRNSVDAFILERLTREGFRPVAEADRSTLIRRLCFDLTGLPPTPQEVEAFVKDQSSDAYEKLVDRLLGSPRYGERWGRHWLDVIRFAETEGFEYDRHRPGAWRFRDYVIDSFNKDKPYDRFVLEQLAGDEIEPDNRDCQVAAGFNRLGPVRRNAGNPEQAFSRHEVLNEMTDIIGPAFLGLTVGCARCHDHKFDRVSQEDYYCLQAFFAAAQERDLVLADAKEQTEWKTRHGAIQDEIKKLEKSLRTLTGAERDRAEEKMHGLERSLPAPLPAISTIHNDAAKRTPVHLLKRGDPDKKDRQVRPRVPTALAGPHDRELSVETSNPRTELARWIVGKDNPLTARVMVNRIWQYHFGAGLVPTSNDFGVNGSKPSHPELLDWLANQFVAGGWRIKPMHRLIVLSSTYRQSGNAERGVRNAELNPHLLASFPQRRLNAEEVRDAMLMISGRLHEKMGGPSVIVPVEKDLVHLLYTPAQWIVTPDKKEHDRRSVYLLAKRNLRLPFLETFDQPDAQTSCGKRESSTHALQALELLNGKLANSLAESLAERLRREVGEDRGRQIERAYLLAVGRLPTATEKQRAIEFLKKQPLKEFALAVFNLNGFLYVK